MARDDTLARWLQSQIKRLEPRARSLIVTVFGDSIEPRGGTLWLGSLVRLLAPFGVQERSVRTSVFRLSQEGWLEQAGEKVGKRSYYRMTAAGRQRAAHAHRRIYDAPSDAWTGTWTLLLLAQSASPALRHDLQWQGFGRLAPQLYAHPAPDVRALREIIGVGGAREGIVGFQASTLDFAGSETPEVLVRRGWPLENLAEHYQRFLATFGAVKPLIAASSADDEQLFVLRTLLIHEFRRSQLRDPHLPSALLPREWPGAQARALCADLYHACSEAAERHLTQSAEGPDGALHPPAPYFFLRFSSVDQRIQRSPESRLSTASV